MELKGRLRPIGKVNYSVELLSNKLVVYIMSKQGSGKIVSHYN